jgi:hypothetical protein
VVLVGTRLHFLELVALLCTGLRQNPWNRVAMAGRLEENSSKAMVSPKRERESTDGPLNAHPAPWDKSDSVSRCCCTFF